MGSATNEILLISMKWMLVHIVTLAGLAILAAKRAHEDNSKRETKITWFMVQETRTTSRSLILLTLASLLAPSSAHRVLADNPSPRFARNGRRIPDTSPLAVQLSVQNDYVVMSNGIVEVTLSKPDGIVTAIQYNGIDNMLAVLNKENDRGYWDMVWAKPGTPGTKGIFDRMECRNFSLIVENEEQIEVSFTRSWDPSEEGSAVPLNIDKRFVMLRGSSGFYTYAIYEHLAEWPGFIIDNTRVVFKLDKDRFNYMVIADDRQRYMPLPDDRSSARGRQLAYPEAVLLVDPIEPQFKGEVDDKYEYSSENQNNKVHGWICSEPAVGFWQITPSSEFRSGGPLKQGLTSHVGPTNLAIFHSAHYSGSDMILRFGPNEAWKKVFGPIFMYMNSLSDENDDCLCLWEDAKQQMMKEEQSWPYTFPASQDFPPSDQRGTVCGRLLVLDRYVSDEYIHAEEAHVGLALPGDAGSWQTECKGYQFWSKTDKDGYFIISNIRAGDYNLFASVPGFIGDYRFDSIIEIRASCEIDLGSIVYEPPRDGPTLWEIGVPDRSAAEFYVPHPNPMYINPLYVNHPDSYRQYGLWERYAELYPHQDLIYDVDQCDYTKDWFFAQVTRKIDNHTYVGSTWQIKFEIDNVDQNATYKLRLALATAHSAELQVRVNDPRMENPPVFSSGVIGKDNTIARHGIHGLYRFMTAEIGGDELVQGSNTIFLTQPMCTSPFQGIMYDYIRLEGPPELV